MIPSALVWIGIALALAGLPALVHPLPRLRLPTRRRAALWIVGALAVALAALLAPAGERQVREPQSHLDRLHPRWQFSEFHHTWVAAPPSTVYQAVKATTASEIALFRTLTAIRRFGRSGPESILNAPDSTPILDVAARSGFRVLADDLNREIVLTTLVIARPLAERPQSATQFFQLDDTPGFARGSVNFLLAADGAGTRVSTETRVWASDPASRRVFAAYWRLIYPGSSLIRYSWLRAIRRRAESREAPPPTGDMSVRLRLGSAAWPASGGSP